MGQYYLRARYYNPVIGRFTQEDVYRGDGLNLYTYCKNNPVTYYDPSGFGGEDNCGGKDKTEDVNSEGTGETGSHHKMRGEIYRDGELIYGEDYVSGGGVGGYRDGLLHHTERKFLTDADVIVQSNDSIVMQGEKNPCKPGCQPAIREFVQDNNVTATYTATKTGQTFKWSSFSDNKLKGTVLQQVYDSNNNKSVGSWRYWQNDKGYWKRAAYGGN